ncbi:hypothetical protein [Corynebacterium cystitidis]|uniref:hypothetical protein n=1 Tax=Corynebacterium cystitidis TaxID=35757 RepID=UPI00211DEB30|nr:hypothetical protein [Corynebacterium cystitidis]
MDTNAQSVLDAVAEVERTIQFRCTLWPTSWRIRRSTDVACVATSTRHPHRIRRLRFPLRHRLFGPQRTRLHPNEDPFDDPKIRGSWSALIASLVATALVFVCPNETVWVTVAAGIVGTLAGILYLRDNQP